jgi:hypothetical protein
MSAQPSELLVRYADAEVLARFWAKVDRRGPSECWEWTASRNRGYGQFGLPWRKSPARAHRISYELAKGPIPAGLVIDHLCSNPPCVNPAHLEAVTYLENTRRGRLSESLRERGRRITHCKRDHEFTAENTYRLANGTRGCRECRNARARAWNKNKRMATIAEGV